MFILKEFQTSGVSSTTDVAQLDTCILENITTKPRLLQFCAALLSPNELRKVLPNTYFQVSCNACMPWRTCWRSKKGTFPHQFALIKPQLSLTFAGKHPSRVLCLYLAFQRFLGPACSLQASPSGSVRLGKEKGKESLHCRLKNLNSAPRTPIWLLWC